MRKMELKDCIICSLFAAICCVCSIITVPTGIVPVTLGTFGVMLTALISGAKRGTISVLIFVLLGAIGVPVFSGMQGGFQVIIGPTGGYIYSYLIMAFIIGVFAKNLKNKFSSYALAFLGCVIGIAVCYAIGTFHFMLVTKNTLVASLGMCVVPFIPFDIIKAVVAVGISPSISKIVNKY